MSGILIEVRYFPYEWHYNLKGRSFLSSLMKNIVSRGRRNVEKVFFLIMYSGWSR